MALVLPNPSVPANGQSLDATPMFQNQTAIVQAIQSFDGSQIQGGTVSSSALVSSINPNTLLYDTTAPFVSSGLTWGITGGLVGNMASGVAYIVNNGAQLLYRVSVGAVATKTFTGAQDTYIDVDYNGNVYYISVGNGATAPALTANSIRIAEVITSVSAITSIKQTGRDSIGNPIYNQSSNALSAIVPVWRQGGDANQWNTTGTTNYSLLNKNVFAQTGSVAYSGADVTVTFPTPFFAKPLIWAGQQGDTSISQNTACEVISTTQTNFVVAPTTRTGNCTIAWLAIGF